MLCFRKRSDLVAYLNRAIKIFLSLETEHPTSICLAKVNGNF